jgi:Zn-dependent M28 family amino/carboxypeptidase
VLGLSVGSATPARAAEGDDIARLMAAMLGDTPLAEDLRVLTDEIGGRPTGSHSNLRAVAWALKRFQDAGVDARREPYSMPALWLERSASVRVEGDVSFAPRAAAMPFSTGTPPDGLVAPLVDGGRATPDDFERLAERARGAFVLVATDLLVDLDSLIREYTDAAEIERRAFDAGVAGVVYMGSRSRNVLYRHHASLGPDNKHPLLVMERDGAKRVQRLLRAGKKLSLRASIDVQTGGAYESFNVVGEIKGEEQPDEFVLIGAHLDAWGLGTGALDNGCNVALVIDIARQMKRLGLRPRRSIRFALFNGEEQGLHGSRAYTERHAEELDNHVMASSYDLGSGRITGFFTNGRVELLEAVQQALLPVAGLGPFEHINEPVVATDNFDFMLHGVGNLVAAQEFANYGPNYHARSDTFDKVDLRQLRLNAAIAAAVTYGFAQMDVDWGRQTRDEIETLVESTDLGQQMRSFGFYDAWAAGKRGRAD